MSGYSVWPRLANFVLNSVVGISQWWHGWAEDDFDELAGALVAGRKCSLSLGLSLSIHLY